MSDYIRRSDLGLTDFEIIMCDGDYKEGIKILLEKIEKAPAADVVEVVRCRDCRYRDPEDKKCDSGELERAGCVFPVDDDYFCAYGKR